MKESQTTPKKKKKKEKKHPDLKKSTHIINGTTKMTFQNTHNQGFKTSPAKQMVHLLSLRGYEATLRKSSHEVQKGSISHATPIIIFDLANIPQTP